MKQATLLSKVGILLLSDYDHNLRGVWGLSLSIAILDSPDNYLYFGKSNNSFLILYP